MTFGDNKMPRRPSFLQLCRSNGLFQPFLQDVPTTPSLEGLWKQFVAAESQKRQVDVLNFLSSLRYSSDCPFRRTIFALHNIDSVWYQTLSLPRSLSHLEIKYDMPASSGLWHSESAAEWAHFKLANGLTTPRQTSSSQTLQYSETIRHILNATDIDPSDVAQLGLQGPGVVSVIHFILSSLREVSGWSTMTGSVSMERLEVSVTGSVGCAIRCGKLTMLSRTMNHALA